MDRILEDGGSLTAALEGARLFPVDYCQMAAVGEESGTMAERMQWLGEEFQRRAEDGMRAFAAVLARLIWLAVAIVIIVFIVRFFGRYLSMIQGAAS